MATRSDVVEFLNLFKGCVSLGRYDVRTRHKNRQGLIDLGLSAVERREILLGLEPENYIAGPKPDDTDPAHEVWEFGKKLGEEEIYIKLRVVRETSAGRHHALVWSFHPAEFKVRYPLKGGTP